MEIRIKKADKLMERPDDSNLGFGSIFTDHMLLMNYTKGKGWHDLRIEPNAPVAMPLSTMVYHYGQAVFEGLKAFRTSSGEIRLFRPKDNIARLNRSSRSLCIPEIDEKEALEALTEFIRLEKDWIPSATGTSLYVRPTIISTDAYLGVRASHSYLYFVILSPVGAYYSEGFNPVKIWVTKDHVRAVRGGLGEAKTPANYAASLYAGEEAVKNGYTQVLWLDGVEQKYIEEVGSMNIFFVIDGEVVTPMLNRSILPGITRDSVLKLTTEWGMPVSEKKITIDELFEAHENGKVSEVFGTGTAAVISPVGELKYGDKVMYIGDGKVGPVAEKLFKTVTDIQYGNIEDTHGWIETV